MSIKDTNAIQLKKLYPDGRPDYLVVDMQRPIGVTSKEQWLEYLSERGLTEETFEHLDDFKRYKIHCSYCHEYNIPNIED